jgi:hypothetical protein
MSADDTADCSLPLPLSGAPRAAATVLVVTLKRGMLVSLVTVLNMDSALRSTGQAGQGLTLQQHVVVVNSIVRRAAAPRCGFCRPCLVAALPGNQDGGA